MKFLVLIFVGVVVGCSTGTAMRGVDESTAESFSVEQITDGGRSQLEIAEENRQLLEQKLGEVLNFCQPRLSGFEEKSRNQATKAYWLSMSGLIVGSIVVPALTAANATANAAWISGLSGWAGATNFAGQALRESGLSGSAIAQTRNGIIRNVSDAIEIAIDSSKTFEERRDALLKARTACVMYEISVPSIPEST